MFSQVRHAALFLHAGSSFEITDSEPAALLLESAKLKDI